MNHAIRSLLATVMACGLARQEASAQTGAVPDLRAASIEDLMNIQVTTASRAVEGLAAAPARVQVVTAAQIERRGYRSVLDVLKDLADFKVDLTSTSTFMFSRHELDPQTGYWNVFRNMKKSFKYADGSMAKDSLRLW